MYLNINQTIEHQDVSLNEIVWYYKHYDLTAYLRN